MRENEFIYFILICSYFIFYVIKCVSSNCKNISKSNIFKNIKNKMESEFQSDITSLKNNLKFNNFKEILKSIFIIFLGIFIILSLIPILIISQILKWPVIFLNKIISIEKNNGFEFFEYIILPLILGVVFIKCFAKLSIQGTSLNVIICFYNKLIELQSLYKILIVFLLVLAVFKIFIFIFRDELLMIKDIFNYLFKWIQLLMVIFIFIAVLATYILLLDEVNNGITSFDSYTIIPIFITSCITSSKIIIKLLNIVSLNKVELNYRPKRYPYINIKNVNH